MRSPRSLRRSGIERGFERRDERLAGGLVRTRQSGWRHHAGADLANHFFPDVGMGRHVADPRRIEREVGGLQPLVVTADAVLIDERATGR